MKIALILNDDFSMYHFRGGLIRELVRRGLEVSVIVPPGQFNSKLEELGSRCIPVPMERFISPLKDIVFLIHLYKIFKTEKFDIVHNMTIKPNIYGTFAAALAKVQHRVCLVSGTGFLFLDDIGWRAKLVRIPVTWMYKLAMALVHKTWFQNADDLQYFLRKRLINNNKGVVIRSGGINIEEYSPFSHDKKKLVSLREELGLSASHHSILMVAARMVWSKGVKEFIEAAFQLHGKFPDWYFIMVCPKDENSPDLVPTEYLHSRQLERLIIIDTFRYDIKNFIALSDIMVLPSYYPEGVPRTLLEGLAMAKPIITTLNQGCRETVDDGKNGFLIPVKNIPALVEKLQILMTDENLRLNFGGYSRKKVELEFSETIVIDRIIREIYKIHSIGTN